MAAISTQRWNVNHIKWNTKVNYDPEFEATSNDQCNRLEQNKKCYYDNDTVRSYDDVPLN